MGELLDRCRELRNDESRHISCAQAVFVPVAEKYGMDTEMALKISSNFRAGMLTGGTCGAVTGGLMALGLADASPKTVKDFQSRVKQNHDGTVECRDLLGKWFAAGNKDKKPHCDEMCYECMRLIEAYFEETNNAV